MVPFNGISAILGRGKGQAAGKPVEVPGSQEEKQTCQRKGEFQAKQQTNRSGNRYQQEQDAKSRNKFLFDESQTKGSQDEQGQRHRPVAYHQPAIRQGEKSDRN
jgi:hypothetical protein